jgi:hypothetical protein
MSSMHETVRRVVQALLDVQIAIDPEADSEGAVDIANANLLSIPGAIAFDDESSTVSLPDLTGLLCGVDMLVAQLLVRVADAEGQPREAVVSDLRVWVDQTLA